MQESDKTKPLKKKIIKKKLVIEEDETVNNTDNHNSTSLQTPENSSNTIIEKNKIYNMDCSEVSS